MTDELVTALLAADAHVFRQQLAGKHEQDRSDAVEWQEQHCALLLRLREGWPGMIPDLDDRFFDFHLDNPHVYAELVHLAREAKAAGKERIGIRMVWETARWNLWLRTKGDGEFRLNNNLHSRYARLIMAQEPDLAGVFAVRKLAEDP